MSNSTFETKALSRKARIFAEKAARSIIEIQESIESVGDIAILLEVTGITKEDLEQNGFNDVHDLAVYINNFIDFYEVRQDESEITDAFLTEIPSKKKSLMESLALTFPWLGTLAVFFLSGVSLWMISGLPTEGITALMIGVFLGIFITEGPLTVFQRIFVTNYTQLNISEAKRTIKRNFVVISLILIVVASLLTVFGYLADSPTGFVILSVVSLVTVSLHRASYMIVYALKRLRILAVSYSIALALLLLIYFLASDVMPDTGSRYLVALGVAFLWLSISAFYAYKIFGSSSTRDAHPHFYKSPGSIKNTIKARVRVQLWGAISHYIFGTFLSAMMFGDRLISWFFNPALHSSDASLPLLFNAIYHMGADPAMLVLLVTSVAQYVIIAGFYQEISNITVKYGITQIEKVDEFFRKRYRKLMLASIATSCCVALVLNLLGTEIMTHLGVSDVSLNILTIASIGNVFISIFVANGVFATFLNRIKALAIIAVFATLILGLGGFVLAQEGFENIVYAYLASTFVSALLSSLYMMRMIKSASSIFFARFA